MKLDRAVLLFFDSFVHVQMSAPMAWTFARLTGVTPGEGGARPEEDVEERCLLL